MRELRAESLAYLIIRQSPDSRVRTAESLLDIAYAPRWPSNIFSADSLYLNLLWGGSTNQ